MADQPSLFADRVGVLMNWGLGVDSSALLTRWLTEPDTRDFDLRDLVVVTAMTGEEWDDTAETAATHLLPLMSEHHVRYVQVARAGYSARDGIVVLDDSCNPTVLHAAGAYPLSAELLSHGIVPMSAAGMRRCSAKQKGAVIAAAAPVLFPDGRPYRNVVGFCAGEERRACRGEAYTVAGRANEYPLLEWGWDRTVSLTFLAERFGVAWGKSACVMCPFAFHRGVGANDTVLARYLTQPDAALRALAVEYGARCLNPTQTLTVGAALVDVLAADGRFAGVLAEHAAALDSTEHALMRVRRIIGGRFKTWRSVRRTTAGTRAAMVAELAARAAAAGQRVVFDGVTARVWVRTRGSEPTTCEEQWVVAPAWIIDKERPGFDSRWRETVERVAA